MKQMIKNILAGLGSFPVVISLIFGMSLASGINPHFVLIPVVVTNIIGTLVNPKDHIFYQLPVGLVVIFASILHGNELNLNEPNLGSLIMLMIPAVLFTALSFVPFKFSIVPISTAVTVSLGIGVILIVKQLPNAFGIDTVEQLKSLDTINWLQFGLAVFIPSISLISNRYFRHQHILLFSFILVSSVAFTLPIEYHLHELGQFHSDQLVIKNWSLTPLEFKSALTNGITIFLLLLCYFIGDFSAISKFGISEQTDLKKSLRTIGLGNMVGSFFGLVPANISLIESAAINENKGNNRIAIYTLVILLSICTFLKVDSLNFPLFPIAGLIIYLGIRLISHSFKLLKGENFVVYIIGILGGVVILFMDYISGFLFSLVCGLIYNAVKSKRTTTGAKNP